jgi:aconitate hydratase/homoaconitate hydratase
VGGAPGPRTAEGASVPATAEGASVQALRPGDVLQIRVDWSIASELAWNGMERTYAALGRPPVFDRDRVFLAVDHTVDPVTLAGDARTQKLVQLSRDFAKESRITHFYDANWTILHTKFYRDLVQPGEVVLGADSHTSSHGGMSAFAIGLGGADVTVAMVLGASWIQVPDAIAVEYSGAPAFGIGGKDIILRTLGLLGRNTVAMERSVEYRGDAVRNFSMDTRFTIANMTAEFGGLNGIFEADGVTAAWLGQRGSHNTGSVFFKADADAPYLETHRIDITRLGPQVALPFSPDKVKPVEEVAGLAMDGLFIGACTTTEEELALGALVLEQAWKDAPPRAASARQLVVPGSVEIQRRLAAAGLWSVYERAGFRVGAPGCSMCLGIASEKAGRDERWLSSQNRNYENRMGPGSLAYLASAATVAASAREMKVADPRGLLKRVDRDRWLRILGRDREVRVPEVRTPSPAAVPAAAAVSAIAVASSEVVNAAPTAASRVRGRVQKFGDHVDTDQIIPGEFCHLTELSELGAHAFHHVRPEFVPRAREGADLVVAGEGWGSGSSREQAVLALKGAGVKAVVAKSFAFIHKRNLVNEALPFLVVRDEAFHALVREGDEVEVDLAVGEVIHAPSGRRFRAEPPAPIIRALTSEGGLVPAVRRHGPHAFEALTA